MTDVPTPDEKRMRLRYSGTCRLCGAELPAKVEAIYEPPTKSVRCVACTGSEPTVTEVSSPIDAGTAGASARREYERRKTNREQRIRESHPKLGGLILALSDDPQSTKAWAQGAVGEERLGARLDRMTSESCVVLHDRKMPGSQANIDHIVVAPDHVWVIDAKRYKGRPNLRIEGGILRPRAERLFVGSRDCSKLVEGVLKQVDAVRRVLDADFGDVSVQGALCFVEADWPLVGGSFAIGGVDVLWPKLLSKRLLSEAEPLFDVQTVARALAARLER